jgi:hypothetical protein
MSWSVSTKGTVADVKTELERQFSYPLAATPGGLCDEGERETVRRVQGMIAQCLDTFGPEKTVGVSASGHMGFENWDTKAGAFQVVAVSIQPMPA